MAQCRANQRRSSPDSAGQDRAGDSNFHIHHKLTELAAEQGVKPVMDPSDLLGDFWPEEEATDELLSTLREWRSGEHDRREL